MDEIDEINKATGTEEHAGVTNIDSKRWRSIVQGPKDEWDAEPADTADAKLTGIHGVKERIVASKAYRSCKRIVHNSVATLKDIHNAASKTFRSTEELAESFEHMISATLLSNQQDANHTTTNSNLQTESEDASLTSLQVTLIRDKMQRIQSHLQYQESQGANSPDNSLNTPFLLLIFPIAPLAYLALSLAFKMILPSAQKLFWIIYAWITPSTIFSAFVALILFIFLRWNALRANPVTRRSVLQMELLYYRIVIFILLNYKTFKHTANQTRRKMGRSNLIKMYNAKVMQRLGLKLLLRINAWLSGYRYVGPRVSSTFEPSQIAFSDSKSQSNQDSRDGERSAEIVLELKLALHRIRYLMKKYRAV